MTSKTLSFLARAVFVVGVLWILPSSIAFGQEAPTPEMPPPPPHEMVPGALVPPPHAMLPPGRSMMHYPEKSYPDSTEFRKLFKEFYPMIKPQQSIEERAQKQFKMLARNLKDRGIDSAEAWKKVVAQLDPKIDEEAIYRTYRALLSAEELKTYMAFIKSPTGKHILEVAPRLLSAKNEGDMQIRHAIQSVVPPMPRAQRDARAPHGVPPPPGTPGYIPGPAVQDPPMPVTPESAPVAPSQPSKK